MDTTVLNGKAMTSGQPEVNKQDRERLKENGGDELMTVSRPEIC